MVESTLEPVVYGLPNCQVSVAHCGTLFSWLDKKDVRLMGHQFFIPILKVKDYCTAME